MSWCPAINRIAARAAAVAVAGLVGATGLAGAAAATPAHKHHSQLPVVKHASTLATEPVVEATKGKPPKKLEVKDLVKGTGPTVTMSSTVKVVYVGASYKTGKDFTQQTWVAKKATTFPLSGVVRGFAEGLVGMKVGGRREIVIPPKLGYGNQNYGPIKANETLVFVVDLKAVTG